MEQSLNSRKFKAGDQDLCGVRVVHTERVEKARKESIPGTDLDRLSGTYRVLGDSTRLKIVMALEKGEISGHKTPYWVHLFSLLTRLRKQL